MNDSWRRRKAEEKIAEWSVERDGFVIALEKLVSEKRLAGEWTFEKNEYVEKAICYALRFFDEYSHKIVPLSDGRFVYFVPDERAKDRWDDLAFCWAEYAFHSVSSGGARIPGKNYNFRKYNEYKVVNTDLIESTLLAERCVPVLKDNRKMDSVKFFGNAHLGGIFDVVVRLDDFGNANANLTEVTFEASSQRKQKNMPQLVSLAEAIRTVVSHQTATGTYPPNVNNISNSENACKGTVGAGCSDIAVIILVGQEKIHLKRCVEKLEPLEPKCIWLIESQPDDGGVAIAKETAAKLGLRLETMYHKWPGLYAQQFQWALDELEKRVGVGEWILRLDADEYLTEETCEKIVRLFDCSDCSIDEDVAGMTLELKRIIFGGEIRHATNGIRLLRIFRRGRARIEQRAMDEHMLVDGKVIDFDGAFYDHNLNSFEWWQEKHRGYAKREAQDAVALFDCSDCSIERLRNPSSTDRKKIAYYKLPRYFRAVMYFCIRYFLKGGFLDGKAGWRWNFWQGLWYRWIVDREIGRIRCRS